MDGGLVSQRDPLTLRLCQIRTNSVCCLINRHTSSSSVLVMWTGTARDILLVAEAFCSRTKAYLAFEGRTSWHVLASFTPLAHWV